MKQKILENIQNPSMFEKLYRDNQTEFTENFYEIYPKIKDEALAYFWHLRLQKDIASPESVIEKPELLVSTAAGNSQLIFTIIAGLI